MINKDTIIRLAREAGIENQFMPDSFFAVFERFAQAIYRQGLEDAAKVAESRQDFVEQEKADKRFKAALEEDDERSAVDRGTHWLAVSSCNAVLRNTAKAIRAMKGDA